jgi:protein Mpv17
MATCVLQGASLAELDRWRVLRSGLAGFIGHGPLSHCWYGVCEGLFDAIGWNGAW